MDVVLADGDLETAMPGAALAGFNNSSQICSAGIRLFVERRIYVERPLMERSGHVTLQFGVFDHTEPIIDEYVTTGANYCVCAFQWGQLRHEQAMRSIELFVAEVMPHYVAATPRSS